MTHARVGEDYTHATSFSLNFRYQNHNDNLKQIDSQVFPFSSLSKKKNIFSFLVLLKHCLRTKTIVLILTLRERRILLTAMRLHRVKIYLLNYFFIYLHVHVPK